MYYVLHAFTFIIAHALFCSVAFLLLWSKGHVLAICGVYFCRFFFIFCTLWDAYL